LEFSSEVIEAAAHLGLPTKKSYGAISGAI
jgi:hypothetical protein